MSTRKIYARQINPEYQESPLFYADMFDWDAEKLSICGNGHFHEHKTELFERVEQVLNGGELAEALEDIASGEGCYFLPYCKNATEAITDYLPPEKEGRRYSTKQIHELKQLIGDYAGSYAARDCDDILCAVLSIVSGELYKCRTICGCSQGDWNTVFYAAAYWNKEALDNFETEYFNEGTEWIIHDELNEPEAPEDISGYSVYCHAWNTDGIRREIAECYTGVSPEDVVLYEYAGYRKVAEYRLVECERIKRETGAGTAEVSA